ncbi:DUF6292 family protein [Streptomyces vietnamensis]|uniref:DUF6292 domain-containing protein n=1 Tax=Streptomyces vietnamensis TaxID=362257 RepID=A0A0B5ID82_9ACTN|nr:DUF6292 family protein [Streptomyces vietnamensis]AJF70466.1 hypothetical protein SVTN_40615 [Streptomyces vietnamensis]
MIRAGRLEYVQTMADLADTLGKKLTTVRNQKPYAAEGHPAPISSPNSRAQLWDAEQTKAYYAGQPIPELPQVDDNEDLLDRHEAAELLGISPVTWNGYKNDPDLVDGMVLVPAGPKGTEHWPRRLVLAYKNKRPGRAAGGGRPAGSGDMIPRDQILPRIAELLDADPAITLETVAETLGIAKFPTAQSGLATLRGRRIADLVEAQPGLDPKAAALQLGYPTITHRGAITIAERELHARSAKPYLQHTADFLAAAGIAQQAQVEMRQPDGEHLAAAVPLETHQPAPALVWDERFGWRTATSRRHPIGKPTDTPPEGEGIRYLGTGLRPDPEELLAALRDGRKGTKRPHTTP